jgi:uncharacterized protein (TIGR03083 family)
MAPSGVWPLIHGEREALAADLADLTDEQWATASLCPGWSVRDVLGHLTATAKMTPGAFFVYLAQARFRFHDMSDQLIAAEATAVPADGLTEFRKHLGDTTHPPGPVPAMLGEAVVHGEDIPAPARHQAGLPAGGGHQGGELPQGVESPDRQQAPDRRARPAGQRPRVGDRERP